MARTQPQSPNPNGPPPDVAAVAPEDDDGLPTDEEEYGAKLDYEELQHARESRVEELGLLLDFISNNQWLYSDRPPEPDESWKGGAEPCRPFDEAYLRRRLNAVAKRVDTLLENPLPLGIELEG